MKIIDLLNKIAKGEQAMSKIIICPNCKSENLKYFREFYFTRYYKLDENNEPTNKCIRKTAEDDSVMANNWECQDCGCVFGGTASTSCEYKED